MFLLDDDEKLVDAEFSLDVLNGLPCVIIESSGGANPARGVTRRNPDYNKLLGLLLQRLAAAQFRIVAVILDSNRVANINVSDRTVTFDQPYPVNLACLDIIEFRLSLGRAIATMHRTPDAKAGGNAQKRIRICLDRAVSPEQLLTKHLDSKVQIPEDFAPGFTETEKTSLQKARIGQGKFREMVLAAYGSRCPILGVSNSNLLIASHIKPWSVCTNHERLDPKNGILLSPLFDKLFDRGLITFNDDGTLCPSVYLTPDDQVKCNLTGLPTLELAPESKRYMEYHRELVFKRA